MKVIKAFTLIETMVALTIIVMVLGFVTGIIAKTLTAGNENRRTKVNLGMYDLAIRTKTEHDFITADFPVLPHYIIHRDIEHYKGHQDLLLMTITAIDVDKKPIASYHEILIVNE